jgi:hypothetical protein
VLRPGDNLNHQEMRIAAEICEYFRGKTCVCVAYISTVR